MLVHKMEKEGWSMCKAFDDLMKEERREEKKAKELEKERGRKRGKEKKNSESFGKWQRKDWRRG